MERCRSRGDDHVTLVHPPTEHRRFGVWVGTLWDDERDRVGVQWGAPTGFKDVCHHPWRMGGAAAASAAFVGKADTAVAPGGRPPLPPPPGCPMGGGQGARGGHLLCAGGQGARGEYLRWRGGRGAYGQAVRLVGQTDGPHRPRRALDPALQRILAHLPGNSLTLMGSGPAGPSRPARGTRLGRSGTVGQPRGRHRTEAVSSIARWAGSRGGGTHHPRNRAHDTHVRLGRRPTTVLDDTREQTPTMSPNVIPDHDDRARSRAVHEGVWAKAGERNRIHVPVCITPPYGLTPVSQWRALKASADGPYATRATSDSTVWAAAIPRVRPPNSILFATCSGPFGW